MVRTTFTFGNAVATNDVGTTGAATTVAIGSIFSCEKGGATGSTLSGGAASSTFVGSSGGTAGSTFSSGSCGTAPSTFSSGTAPPTFSVSTSSGHNSGSTVIVTNSVAGTSPTDRALERTTIMFDTYWELLDAVDKTKAELDLLSTKKRVLITGMKQTKESYQNGVLLNLSVALMDFLSELEKVNKKLRNLALDYDKNVELLRQLPGKMATEDLLAVRSLRDIQMVRNLQVVCRWEGKVKLVQGGKDPIDQCLDMMRNFEIQMI